MKYPGPIRRAVAFAGGAVALVRRRRRGRAPRVRLRLDHGEATVLPEASRERERLLALARELVSEYEGAGRGG
jgi:hypothetical protein